MQLKTLINALQKEADKYGSEMEVYLETEGDEHEIDHVECFINRGARYAPRVVAISTLKREEDE